MEERKRWKRKGQKIFKKRYWTYVAVCFLLSFFGYEYSTSSIMIHQYDRTKETVQEVVQPTRHKNNLEMIFGEVNEQLDQVISTITRQDSYAFKLAGAVSNLVQKEYQTTLALVTACALELAFIIFLLGPLCVGSRKFYIKAATSNPQIRTLLFGFQKGIYLRNGWTIFLKDFFLLLWTPTIIMPFIKAYEYRLIPYLLADDPNLTRKEAFLKSKMWMKGNKRCVFYLDLSYIGWFFLNILTLGISGIFYSNPYHAAAVTEFYLDLKAQKKEVA